MHSKAIYPSWFLKGLRSACRNTEFCVYPVSLQRCPLQVSSSPSLPPYFGRWDLSPHLQHDGLAGLAGQSSIPLISASSALGWSTCFALMLNINMLFSWTQGSLSHRSSPLTHLLMHSRKRLIFSGAILLASSSWRVIKTNPTAGASCPTINRVFLLSGFPFPWPILYWTHPRWP